MQEIFSSQTPKRLEPDNGDLQMTSSSSGVWETAAHLGSNILLSSAILVLIVSFCHRASIFVLLLPEKKNKLQIFFWNQAHLRVIFVWWHRRHAEFVFTQRT